MAEELNNPNVNVSLDTSFNTQLIADKLESIANSLSLSAENKSVIRDCAITLYTNTNFDMNTKSPIQIAQECITRALVIAKELKSANLL